MLAFFLVHELNAEDPPTAVPLHSLTYFLRTDESTLQWAVLPSGPSTQES